MGLLDLNENIQDTCLKSLMIDFIFDYYKYNKDAYISGSGTYLRRDDIFEIECNVGDDKLPEALIFLKSTSDCNRWKIVIDKNMLQHGNFLLTIKNDLLSIIHMKFVLDYMNKENQS